MCCGFAEWVRTMTQCPEPISLLLPRIGFSYFQPPAPRAGDDCTANASNFLCPEAATTYWERRSRHFRPSSPVPLTFLVDQARCWTLSSKTIWPCPRDRKSTTSELQSHSF